MGHVLFQTPVLICLRLCCVVFVFLISFSVSFVPLSLVFFVFFFSLLRPFYTQENLSCSSYKRVTSHREGEDMGEEEEELGRDVGCDTQVKSSSYSPQFSPHKYKIAPL